MATENTTPGNINRNKQMTIAKTSWGGNDNNQTIYVLECQHDGFRYGSNGSDIFERKCPKCQDGASCSTPECFAGKGAKGNCEKCRVYKEPSWIFDLGDETVRDLNRALHDQSAEGANLRVVNPGGKHNVAAGARFAGEISIDGHVGYYCAGMNQNAHITINGNAGPGLAENMMSGRITVKGDASQYCGATARGGLLVVEGNAAARCGISMKGADIVVGGSIGHLSAFMAQRGRLVVCGDAGDAFGDSIYEARIYVRGKAGSRGADCVEKPMQAEHRAELAALLKRAGFDDVDAGDFRRYGSARELYHFKVDNLGAY